MSFKTGIASEWSCIYDKLFRYLAIYDISFSFNLGLMSLGSKNETKRQKSSS